jgi:hypothetical protein
MTARLIIPSEEQEQKALVKWLSYHPTVREFFCKNTNEGKRTPRQGHTLKLLGLRPGVSDLFIYYPTKTYHGLWLEVKRNKKYTPSEMKTPTWIAQVEFIKTVKSIGYAGEFCYGWNEGSKIIESYLLT